MSGSADCSWRLGRGGWVVGASPRSPGLPAPRARRSTPGWPSWRGGWSSPGVCDVPAGDASGGVILIRGWCRHWRRWSTRTPAGIPESPLRWTSKSTRELAEALSAAGHSVSDDTVGRLLREQGYTLQRTRKTLEGAQHPDRDAQFRYLNEQAKAQLAAGEPVVSVDCKKKELVGQFANGGAEWQPTGWPERVLVHDFPDPKLGSEAKAIPYGVYDLGANAGWVSVGVDHDTSSFAVQTLRRWWQQIGRVAYPDATRLLVSADAGGSNDHRRRLWKTELARLAAETGLEITVCHFPPGTSKWNKIEHRLFSAISINWRGRPLVSHEVIVELIGATTTRTGLTVQAELDPGRYPLGVKVSDEELAAVPLRRHQWHGEWNYTVLPAAA